MNAENGTMDDRYLEWLYGQIASVQNRNPSRSYWELAKQLYSRKFDWFVPNDDNRQIDGTELRFEFIEDHRIEEVDHDWMTLDCSMLEMLIALSRRASFQSVGTPVEWFWKLLDNLDISNYTDEVYEISIVEEVDEIVDRIVNRNYGSDGYGGLFPLKEASEDQRKVEIWYQMSAYLLEAGFLDEG